MEVKTIWKTKSVHCPGGSSWSPALTVVNISSLILMGLLQQRSPVNAGIGTKTCWHILISMPDEFDKLLSTMRSRDISVSIIIQNLAQLKALFEKQWESIVGNCDEFLYLGGNEQSTHEYVSKLLGKETIDTNTYGRSRGRNGSYSTNYQLAGRELMTPDEVRMLDNQYALLFIRGERPIRDLKYDILHHPNVALTTDGSAPAYTHGEDTRSIASMAFSFDKKAVKNAEKMEAEKHEFLLYSEEELEELLDKKEKKDHEEA